MDSISLSSHIICTYLLSISRGMRLAKRGKVLWDIWVWCVHSRPFEWIRVRTWRSDKKVLIMKIFSFTLRGSLF